jgi:hypothetical protein
LREICKIKETLSPMSIISWETVNTAISRVQWWRNTAFRLAEHLSVCPERNVGITAVTFPS